MHVTKHLISEKILPVRWTDMDAYQHVTNGSYFDYITETRHDAIIKPFLPHQAETFFLVDVQCNFKLPVVYPDTITAKQYIEQIGNSSFVLSYEFFNERQQLCTTGKATLVTVTLSDHKTIAIPMHIQAILGDDIAPKQHSEKLTVTAGKLLNSVTIPLRWVDMDAFGHVNNTRYFEFMIEARNNLFPNSDIRNDTCLFFLVNSRCLFYKAFYYPDTITIKQYLLRVGETSYTFGYQFFSAKQTDEVYAEGMVTLVCVDLKTHKPIPVAKELMGKLLK